MPQKKDVHIAGYYAPAAGVRAKEGLGHRGGAKRRPRQSRRPSAAKRIIRAEITKGTGPIYLRAGFFRATAAEVHRELLELITRLGVDPELA